MQKSGLKLVAAVAALVTSLSSGTARAELLTLDRAIELARVRSIAVLEAEGEVGVAQAQMRSARQSSIGNPYTDVQIDKGLNAGQTIQALTFTYIPVDIGGQRGKRIEEAEQMISWRKLGLVDARAIAIGDTTAAYGELVTAAARVSFAKSGEQVAREEAKYFAGRFEAKDTTLYEKALADAEVARWMQTRVEAELRVTNAKVRLGELTGAPAVDDPPGDVALLPPTVRASWDEAHIARVVDRAPRIARIQAERMYWGASIDRYKRERIPPVSFEILAGHGSVGEARFGGGIVLTYPITRRYQGEIARAETGRDLASRQAQVYRTILEGRLRAAKTALFSILDATKELDATGLPALEQAVAASQEGYKAGKIELTRVLLARRDSALAKQRRLELIEAAWRAYADLVILSGELP